MNNLNNSVETPIELNKGKMLILAVQHMFAMFGATILVPILVMGFFKNACGEDLTEGLTVSVTLFCAGVGTLIFHLCTKLQVPAFLGSSFAFLGGFYTIANFNTGIYANMDVNEKAAYACGGVVVAGLVYIAMALVIRTVGIAKVMRFLPPVVTGPMIVCIGLSLAPVAVANSSVNWPLALAAILTVIVFNIWGRGMLKLIPILMGVVLLYIAAVFLDIAGFTNTDGSAIINYNTIANASWIGLPPFKMCNFDLTAILVMAPIAAATMMEHIGDMSAISATVGKNFIANPGLNRTMLGDGLATSFAGLIGGPANTTYGENIGVLAMSKVYEPKVVRLAAILAIILSIVPKFSAIISTMPTAIIGGISFILYGMISAIGVRNIVENRVDLSKSRNLIIAAVIFVCGLGFKEGLTFSVFGTSVTLTSLAIAALAGIFLNAVLPGNKYIFDEKIAGSTAKKD